MITAYFERLFSQAAKNAVAPRRGDAAPALPDLDRSGAPFERVRFKWTTAAKSACPRRAKRGRSPKTTSPPSP
ncbi:protein of unknown function (plasmid) [Caballeronia sp. S22]